MAGDFCHQPPSPCQARVQTAYTPNSTVAPGNKDSSELEKGRVDGLETPWVLSEPCLISVWKGWLIAYLNKWQ